MSDLKQPKLLRCPWCNHEAVITPLFKVTCSNIDGCCPVVQIDFQRHAWDNRAREATLIKVLEEVRRLSTRLDLLEDDMRYRIQEKIQATLKSLGIEGEG